MNFGVKKMKYTEAKNLLASAEFIYGDVTQDEIDAVEQQKYVSELDGVKILGTLTAVEELADKELKAGSMSF